MTIEQAKKDLVDYFGLELTDHADRKVTSILSNLKSKNPERVYEKRYIYVNVERSNEPIDLYAEAEKVSLMYNTTVERMRSKCRNHQSVGARAHLVRDLRLNRSITTVQLAKFLNKDHSTIVALAYRAKTNCLLKPLYKAREVVTKDN